MNTILSKLKPIQNLGLVDRVVRFILATLMLGGAIAYLIVYGTYLTPVHGLVMMLSIYPALTGIVGWDPLYQMANIRSCGPGEKNSCGTLPYQVDAAMGNKPIPNNDSDHSLVGSHH